MNKVKKHVMVGPNWQLKGTIAKTNMYRKDLCVCVTPKDHGSLRYNQFRIHVAALSLSIVTADIPM
jgi:hypothetical protein